MQKNETMPLDRADAISYPSLTGICMLKMVGESWTCTALRTMRCSYFPAICTPPEYDHCSRRFLKSQGTQQREVPGMNQQKSWQWPAGSLYLSLQRPALIPFFTSLYAPSFSIQRWPAGQLRAEKHYRHYEKINFNPYKSDMSRLWINRVMKCKSSSPPCLQIV